MIRRLPTLLVVVLAGGALTAGCGASSSTTTVTTVATSPPSAATTSSPAGSTAAGAAGAHGSSPGSGGQTTAKPPAQTTSSTTVAGSTGTWNTVQCNAALEEWYKSHPHAGAQQARTYKITLAGHGCFSARSRTPTIVTTAWNTVRCNEALTAWYRSHRHASAQEARTYKITLAGHGCFSANSLTPSADPSVNRLRAR